MQKMIMKKMKFQIWKIQMTKVPIKNHIFITFQRFNSKILKNVIFLVDLLAGLTDDEDEDMEFLDEGKPNKKGKSQLKKKSDIKSLFASAEEFATLLEDEGQSKVKPGGSNVFANKDNARKYLHCQFSNKLNY